jgi:histidyl-tRNA synthetase
VGVEILGVENPLADVEVIGLGAHILEALGLRNDVMCEINTLGDAQSRADYRERLVAYLEDHRASLSADSRERLERNPLRILDSKDEGDRAIVAGAPAMTESLNDASRAFFDGVLGGLEALGIAYRINPRLVRGLDYYCHTAFEFVTATLGAQGTVLAGGRYDDLIRQMGGPPTPGIGWAAGIERLALMIEPPPPPPRPISVVPVGNGAEDAALCLTRDLRAAGFSVDLAFSGNLGKRMKRANAANARAAVIMGEDELARDAATVRDMDTGDQREAPLARLPEILAEFLGVPSAGGEERKTR